ncbi:hypothetical protein, partial [Haloquadratum walsbyi]|uniref:hypothetical protein n=1 Tax=Haloquadratum walsbyi TaxID=293091 RepID=UPI001AD8FEE9
MYPLNYAIVFAESIAGNHHSGHVHGGGDTISPASQSLPIPRHIKVDTLKQDGIHLIDNAYQHR